MNESHAQNKAAILAKELWLVEVKQIAGEHWPWWKAWYSFEEAYDRGMSPAEAAKDCAAWLGS